MSIIEEEPYKRITLDGVIKIKEQMMNCICKLKKMKKQEQDLYVQ